VFDVVMLLRQRHYLSELNQLMLFTWLQWLEDCFVIWSITWIFW